MQIKALPLLLIKSKQSALLTSLSAQLTAELVRQTQKQIV